MADDIVARLRREWPKDFKQRLGLVNPDGLEAADEISRLCEKLKILTIATRRFVDEYGKYEDVSLLSKALSKVDLL